MKNPNPESYGFTMSVYNQLNRLSKKDGTERTNSRRSRAHRLDAALQDAPAVAVRSRTHDAAVSSEARPFTIPILALTPTQQGRADVKKATPKHRNAFEILAQQQLIEIARAENLICWLAGNLLAELKRGSASLIDPQVRLELVAQLLPRQSV